MRAGWATAQGIATLPLALAGYAALWAWLAASGSDFAMPLGPTPSRFVALMVAVGLLASWFGTLCWNEASQRLPAAISGQLIVFETLAALAYALALRGGMPSALTLVGAALLVAGVMWALHGAAEASASSSKAELAGLERR
jgi:drug/metabolite transporter (DMT)-like permease